MYNKRSNPNSIKTDSRDLLVLNESQVFGQPSSLSVTTPDFEDEPDDIITIKLVAADAVFDEEADEVLEIKQSPPTQKKVANTSHDNVITTDDILAEAQRFQAEKEAAQQTAQQAKEQADLQ